MSKSTRSDLLGRKKEVVASNGKSKLIILPLALMTLLSRYKLSCLIVVFKVYIYSTVSKMFMNRIVMK